MNHRHYILGPGNIPIPVSLLEWAMWFQTADRRVALDVVAPGIEVSTVFLGINHQWGDGPPLLFETMMFDDYNGGGEERRYATWEEAEAGHRAKVDEMRLRFASQVAWRSECQ